MHSPSSCCHRVITDQDWVFVRRLRRLITADSGSSREALSKKLSQAWHQVQANGAPRAVVCHSMS